MIKTFLRMGMRMRMRLESRTRLRMGMWKETGNSPSQDPQRNLLGAPSE